MDGFVLFLGLLAICLILLGYVVITRRGRAGKASADKPSMVNEKTYIRKTSIWNIYSPKMQIVAQFAFEEESEAQKKLAELNKNAKGGNYCLIRAKLEEEIPVEEPPVK